MLFAERPLKNWPKGVREDNFRGFEGRLSDVVRAIKDHHKPLAGLWEKGMGHHFHFMESEITVDVLLRCIDRNITALQIHDGMVVSFRHANALSRIMLNVFHEHTGHEATVNSTATSMPLRRTA